MSIRVDTDQRTTQSMNCIQQSTVSCGRRHCPPARQSRQKPKLLSCCRIISIELVGSHDDQLTPAIQFEEQRRCVGVTLLGNCLGLAHCFPDLTAGLQVVCHKVTLDRLFSPVGKRILHATTNDQVRVQYRATGKSPPDREWSMVLLQIPLPENVASKIKGGHVTGTELNHHSIFARDRRRARHIMPAVKDLHPTLRAAPAPPPRHRFAASIRFDRLGHVNASRAACLYRCGMSGKVLLHESLEYWYPIRATAFST